MITAFKSNNRERDECYYNNSLAIRLALVHKHKQLKHNIMRQVIFTYDNNSFTTHNANSVSAVEIAKLVGSITGYSETIYDTKNNRIKTKEVELRIVRADIF